MDITNYTNEDYKRMLVDFRRFLKNNPKVWAIYQLRNHIVMGSNNILVGKLYKNDYKYVKKKSLIGKLIFRNYQIKEEDKKYYNRAHNIIIRNKRYKDIIDFYLDLGLNWRLVEAVEMDDWVLHKVFNLYICWDNNEHICE